MQFFVLTHRPHEVVVKGQTTFTFVTDGIESAVAQARAAAGDKKVHIMGGGSVIQQALRLVDSLRLHVAPVVLGAGHDDVADGIFDVVVSLDVLRVQAGEGVLDLRVGPASSTPRTPAQSKTARRMRSTGLSC